MYAALMYAHIYEDQRPLVATVPRDMVLLLISMSTRGIISIMHLTTGTYMKQHHLSSRSAAVKHD